MSPLPNDLVCVNGRIVPRAEARVSAFDRGFLYGDGLFETVRAYRGVPFLLERHLERLAVSAAELGIPMPGRESIAGAVCELIALNRLADAYVRITLSRGVHTGDLVPAERLEPTLVVEARELRPYPAEMYRSGMRIAASSFRHDSASPLRRHKTTSYILSIIARREVRGSGADEAILLDPAGSVAEAATANIFAVRGGRLLTPPLALNILPGITRAVVMELAIAAGIGCEEVPFTIGELASADEAFLTSSLMELMPVRSVNGRDLPRPPGAVTRVLAEGYSRLVGRLC